MSTPRSIPFLVLALAAGTACARHAPPVGPQPGRGAAPVAREIPRAAEKERAPAPAEHRLELCALAPHSTTGLRRVEAVRVDGRPDTLALVDGRRVPLSEAVGEVPTAHQTTWFPAKKPLLLAVGPRILRFEIYDVGRVIQAGDLAYLGTVDGLPVYAAAADVARVEKELRPLLAEDHDLPHLLVRSAALRTQLRATDVLYVPLSRTGCVFQPLLRATR